MLYNNLGKSGLQISRLSYGAWVTFGTKIDKNTAKILLKTAYDTGVNFFDNAEAYNAGLAEEIMGDALKELNFDRDSFLVSSKAWFGRLKTTPLPTQTGLSRKHLFEACHQALKRLKVDYLDLYFCHRPDPSVPIEETVRVMTELIWQGKVLYWGTSEWNSRQITEAHMAARQYNLIPPTTEQPQYNMFCREALESDYKRLYDGVGLGTTVWSPLASGILSGKYNDGIPEDSRLSAQEFKKAYIEKDKIEFENKIKKVKKLTTLAKELSMSMAQLALVWCLKNPRVSTVILGASKLDQLKENLESLNHIDKLNSEVMEKIEKILENKPIPKLFFGKEID